MIPNQRGLDRILEAVFSCTDDFDAVDVIDAIHGQSATRNRIPRARLS